MTSNIDFRLRHKYRLAKAQIADLKRRLAESKAEKALLEIQIEGLLAEKARLEGELSEARKPKTSTRKRRSKPTPLQEAQPPVLGEE